MIYKRILILRWSYYYIETVIVLMEQQINFWDLDMSDVLRIALSIMTYSKSLKEVDDLVSRSIKILKQLPDYHAGRVPYVPLDKGLLYLKFYSDEPKYAI